MESLTWFVLCILLPIKAMENTYSTIARRSLPRIPNISLTKSEDSSCPYLFQSPSMKSSFMKLQNRVAELIKEAQDCILKIKEGETGSDDEEDAHSISTLKPKNISNTTLDKLMESLVKELMLSYEESKEDRNSYMDNIVNKAVTDIGNYLALNDSKPISTEIINGGESIIKETLGSIISSLEEADKSFSISMRNKVRQKKLEIRRKLKHLQSNKDAGDSEDELEELVEDTFKGLKQGIANEIMAIKKRLETVNRTPSGKDCLRLSD